MGFKKTRLKLVISLCLVFSQSVVSAQSVLCRITTTKGDIDIELYQDSAPVTVANFLKYVDAELYSESSFFRTCTPENEASREIKIEVIQGGIIEPEKRLDPIPIETTEMTGLSHEDGTLSMARSGPNSATSQFFICINDQPALDFNGGRNPDGFGFAAFGKVINGMDVVIKIQQGDNTKQRLDEPVTILSISRIE